MDKKRIAMIKHFTLRYFLLLLLWFLVGGIIAQPAFTDVTVAKGITDPSNSSNPLEHIGTSSVDMHVASGATWLDFNYDGYLDFYVTMRGGANRLYENNGPPNYDFTEVAATYNIEDTAGDGSGVSACDFDNDGDLDIYICNVNVDRLYRNDGTTFTDITSSAGLSTTEESRSTSASWGDYDKDGYLDLYIAHHRPIDPLDTGARQDKLYHNNGDGTFTDVSALLDVNLLEGWAFIGGFIDYDNDNDLDIFVINDCLFPTEQGRTRIFRNDGGANGINDWTFTEVAAMVGVDDCSNAMGIAVGDINHDGYQEFANSDIGVINFWKNSNGTFSDIAAAAGVNGQNANHYSWGINLFDHNNDGWLDLFLASGSLADPDFFPEPNFFFENNGTTGETFTDKSAIMGMNDDEATRNSIAGDFDNDGDLDIFIVNYEGPFMLKQNNNVSNNWYKVQLIGMFEEEGPGYSNRDGVGAKIALKTSDGITQTIETRAGSSLGGCEQNTAHFGLGTNTSIEELKITWPSGIVQTIENILTVNTTLVVIESPDAPLPIELLNFEAKPNQGTVILTWETQSETDNDYFTIERSIDGVSFKKLGEVNGNGTTTVSLAYTFIDRSPQNGDNYYRLKQTDYNGKVSFSDIRIANLESIKIAVSIVPVPVTREYFDLNYNGSESQVIYEIFDVFGIRIQSDFIQNNETKTINIGDLSNGLYILKLSGKLINHTEKMLIQK